MADTQRTINTLLTSLFQDGQSAGAITEQDMRDLIVSLQHSHGSMHISSAAATTIAGASTPTKAAGTTTLLTGAKDFTMPSDNRLVYGGTPDRMFLVNCAAAIQCATAAQQVQLGIADGGTIIAASEVETELEAANTLYAISTCCMVELSNGDYLEAFVANETAGNNLTVTYMNMSVLGVPT